MYQKIIEEADTIYELDEECVNRQKDERENGCMGVSKGEKEQIGKNRLS